MGWVTSVVGPPDGSMKDYMVSLRKLLSFNHEQYWLTHGPAIPDPIEYVQSFISHREEREDQILEYLKHGPRKIADFVPEMYEKYDKKALVSSSRVSSRPFVAHGRDRSGGGHRRPQGAKINRHIPAPLMRIHISALRLPPWVSTDAFSCQLHSRLFRSFDAHQLRPSVSLW